MTLDRAPAHLADMLGFVRELRAIAAGRPLEAFVTDLATVEEARVKALAARGPS
jgi:hypothetical protein